MSHPRERPDDAARLADIPHHTHWTHPAPWNSEDVARAIADRDFLLATIDALTATVRDKDELIAAWASESLALHIRLTELEAKIATLELDKVRLADESEGPIPVETPEGTA